MARSVRAKTMLEMNLKTAINSIDAAALIAPQSHALNVTEHATLLMAVLNRLAFLEDKAIELAVETFELKRQIPSGEHVEVVSLINALNCKQGFLAEHELRQRSFKATVPVSSLPGQPDEDPVI